MVSFVFKLNEMFRSIHIKTENAIGPTSHKFSNSASVLALSV